MLSMSVNKTWQLYRLTTDHELEKHDYLSFTRHIVIGYLQRYSQGNNCNLSIDTTNCAADRCILCEVKFGNVGHTTKSIPKQCRYGECGKKHSTGSANVKFHFMLTSAN